MSFDTVDYTAVDNMASPDAAFQITDALRKLPGIVELTKRGFEHLEIAPGDSLLEVGCGTGEDSRNFSELVGTTGLVTAIDTSDTMLEEAKRRTPKSQSNITYHNADIQKVDFASASFSKCWSQRVFQHLPNPEQALGEIHRVLKPEGRLVILDTDWETFVIDSTNKKLTRKITEGFCDIIQNGWIGRQLPRLCTQANFQVVDYFSNTIIANDLNFLLNHLGVNEVLHYLTQQNEVSSTEVKSWKEELQRNSDAGSFFYSVTMFGVAAKT